MKGMVVHAGGWDTSIDDVRNVVVPNETDSYVPVPYGDFINTTIARLSNLNLRVVDQKFALARSGGQMFGALRCQNGINQPDWSLSIGLRSSYDRSLKIGLAAGHEVFVCDNLAFSGEVVMQRMHTGGVLVELPNRIDNMLGKVVTYKDKIMNEISLFKESVVDDLLAHDVIFDAARHQIIGPGNIIDIVDEWNHPTYDEFEECNAWSLFNAFTTVMGKKNPAVIMTKTVSLTNLFNNRFAKDAEYEQVA